MNLPRSDRLIVHLDMNSFFASVEQQAHRSFRGRPLGVCAYLGQHGCVIAASIEAKQCGVKVGMTVQMARQRAPNMAFVQADPVKYRSVISRVFVMLHELTDQVEHYSIDEAFLDLTGWYPDALATIEPLLRVKQRIRDEVGEWLGCSIGVGPTRLLAKMASDHKKPNGFTMVSHESAKDFLGLHRLTDVCGIGTRTERRLNRLGVHSILDFIDYPTANLLRVGGRNLYFLQAGLLGLQANVMASFSATVPKSVGHSYCVPLKTNQDGLILPVFMKLIEKVGQRLRALHRESSGLQVVVSLRTDQTQKKQWGRYSEATETRYHRFPEPCSDSFSLMETGLRLLTELWNGEQTISFLAITCSDLVPPSSQRRFNTKQEGGNEAKHTDVSRAVQSLQEKYGSNTIVFGQMSKLTTEAPDRIGFRKTEGVEVTSSQETVYVLEETSVF